MDTDNLSSIHIQCCSVLEELYVARGLPVALDQVFIQEYFKLVQEKLKLNPEEPATRAPHTTSAVLSQQDRGLVEVVVPSKNEKFRVSAARPLRTITGTSQRFGSDRGRGTYLMTSVQGIPNITIKTGSAVISFVGLPNSLASESGTGEWVGA